MPPMRRRYWPRLRPDSRISPATQRLWSCLPLGERRARVRLRRTGAGVVEPRPHQGDVYWTDPDPTRGREQAKSRPFVIVSVDQLNQTKLGLSPRRASHADPLRQHSPSGDSGLGGRPKREGLRDARAAARSLARAVEPTARQLASEDSRGAAEALSGSSALTGGQKGGQFRISHAWLGSTQPS